MRKSFIYLCISILMAGCSLDFLSLQIIKLGHVEPVQIFLSFPPQRPATFLRDFRTFEEELVSNSKNFIEINFPESKVKIFKNGIVDKDFSILMRGDPYNWGGSASGLYQVISKYREAFSVVAEVYMPYSLSYYGKYYVHGKPYFYGGEEFQSDASGGCIQLANEDAKDVYEFAERKMPIVVIDRQNDNYKYPFSRISEFPKISAPNYLVADLDSGFVFAEKESKKPVPIASLTKLMTAVIVSENIDLRKSISVASYMLEPYGSTTGLTVGKNFRVIDLFYPLLVESSNDAAEVLSYFLGREKTIRLMNEKTKAILMENTNFIDTHGYDPKNISTAQDIFYLTRYILNNRPLVWDITKDKEVISYGQLTFENLKNKNFFAEDNNFIGGKTGYILSSGYTGVFIFRFKGEAEIERRVAIIILGSENFEEGEKSLKKEVQKTYEWLGNNYF